MEAKLTNMLRRKERKNRKDMQVSIGVDEGDLLQGGKWTEVWFDNIKLDRAGAQKDL